ncbi:UNVERIFIED_CONTAM: hypothetical protein Scaly_2488600 [Sesamum calycinum]|uniref:Uncharacterized protein n=1 Tax=Sesamum calycinum TaxID=2727403 RepID=A0AAW2LSW1_9LAMI
MPKAVYTLTKYQKRRICDQIRGLEFFDGYASNLARCIDMKELRMHGMKNHDCHIFMQKLTFIDFRGMVPEHVWSALMETFSNKSEYSLLITLSCAFFASKTDPVQTTISRAKTIISNGLLSTILSEKVVHQRRGNKLFLNELYEHHYLEDPNIDLLVAIEFKDWFKHCVKPELNYTKNELLMLHYWGPRADLMMLPCYFVNDYNFHTKRHNLGK